MNNEKISIQDLVEVISKRTGNSKKKTDDFIRVFQDTIEDALVKDGLVKIKGFGTFKLVWNEARKSVNVQSKQEYVIPGHYKASFTPDPIVKDIINESKSITVSASKAEINPLEKLNEQAEEIKLLISELGSLAPEIKTEEVVVVAAESKPEVVIEAVKEAEEEVVSEVVEEIEAEVKVSEAEIFTKAEKPLDTSSVVVTAQDNKDAEHHAPADYKIHERDIPVKKKKKSGLIIVIIILLLAAVAFLYLSYIQVFKLDMYKAVSSVEAIFTQKEEKAASQKITPKPKPKTLVLPADTVTKDTVKLEPKLTNEVEKEDEKAMSLKSAPVVKPKAETKQEAVVSKPAKAVAKSTVQTGVKPAVKLAPADSYTKSASATKTKNAQSVAKNQKAGKVSDSSTAKVSGSIFEQPREFTVFIATVTIKKGSHLTLIAEKYYGHRNFWVYIYEANRDKIQNPDALPAGFKVKIPLLNPALVDASNPECVEYGRQLEIKYVNEYKAKK